MATNDRVALEFTIGARDTDCAVKVNGQYVEHIHAFDIHAEWGAVTTFALRGIIAGGQEIAYRGYLCPEPTEEGE